MIEVKIPTEIRDYKGKLIAGLNVRQIAAIGGALLVSVPLVLLGKDRISEDILPWLVILGVAPFAGWGFMTYKGMRFEEFVKALFEFNFLPQKRVYEDTDVNLLCDIKDEIVRNDVLCGCEDDDENIGEWGNDYDYE